MWHEIPETQAQPEEDIHSQGEIEGTVTLIKYRNKKMRKIVTGNPQRLIEHLWPKQGSRSVFEHIPTLKLPLFNRLKRGK